MLTQMAPFPTSGAAVATKEQTHPTRVASSLNPTTGRVQTDPGPQHKFSEFATAI